jgi:glutamate dehydrogenase (NAD(P)+)
VRRPDAAWPISFLSRDGHLGIEANGATAVVQGYGNVGAVAASSLARMGLKIIAVSDAFGGLYNAKGIDLVKLDEHVAATRSVVGFDGAEPITNEQLLLTPCDILVPAALERQITADNAAKIQCRILAEGANGPTTPEADAIISQRPEIFVIPDILCNAGGVIVSYFEWVQDLQSFFWDEGEVMSKLYRILEKAFIANAELQQEARREHALRRAEPRHPARA